MPWMALGGTEVNIPFAILEIVAVQSVLGQHRSIPANEISANMLSQAKALCLGLLGPGYGLSLHGSTFDPRAGHGYLDALPDNLNNSLIWANGDAELWIDLCSVANPPPVHVLLAEQRPTTRRSVHPGQQLQPRYRGRGAGRDGRGVELPGRRPRRRRSRVASIRA